ncbi:MAG TPA: hypothetical protein VII90_05875, partial [Anaerolineales bacterium]
MKKFRIPLILAGIFLLILVGQAVEFSTAKHSTPTLSVALGQGETGPHIVQQSPIEGERLSLSPVMKFTFDREMNQSATGVAWS